MSVLSRLERAWVSPTCLEIFTAHVIFGMVVNIPGFYDIVHIVMYGYGSILAVGGLSYFFGTKNRPVLSLNSPQITAGILSFYGIRLITYLFYRSKFTDFEKDVMRQRRKEARISHMPILKKATVYIAATCLFGGYVLPLYFKNYVWTTSSTILPIKSHIEKIGNIIAITGMAIESIADYQKSAHKYKNGNTPVMTGIYKMCRHPNYLGELMFHYGTCLGCVSGCISAGSTLGVLASPIMCSLEMYRATKELDIGQNIRYDKEPNYSEYVKKTPCLFPIPGLTNICSGTHVARAELESKS